MFTKEIPVLPKNKINKYLVTYCNNSFYLQKVRNSQPRLKNKSYVYAEMIYKEEIFNSRKTI